MKFLFNRYLIVLSLSAVFFTGLTPSARAAQTGEMTCDEISAQITETNHFINENGDRRGLLYNGSGKDGTGTLPQLENQSKELQEQLFGLGQYYNASKIAQLEKRIAQMQGDLDSINLNFFFYKTYNEILEEKRIKYCDKTLINNSDAAKIHSVDTDHADENSSQAGTKITSDEARK